MTASVAPAPAPPRRRALRLPLPLGPVLAGLVVALVATTLTAAVLGQVGTSPIEVIGSILRAAGIDVLARPAHVNAEVTLWHIRFPRIVLAIAVGAGLGVAGALLQGVFANPLAEPGLLGVSAGAAVAAAATIVFGGPVITGAGALGPWAVAAAAFVGGLLATATVYALARSGGRTEVVTLILLGVAVNAFAGGLIALLTFIAGPAARDQIVFWQLGSLAGTTWTSVAVVVPIVLVTVVAAILRARGLDLLSLGEPQARHLGVDVEGLRRHVIVLVALLVAAGVAFTGIIAFVGLVVPHALRILVGPGHRGLLPTSALGGGLVLLLADMTARSAIAHADLPLGMLTALLGAPVFFVLLRRTRARQGGWA